MPAPTTRNPDEDIMARKDPYAVIDRNTARAPGYTQRLKQAKALTGLSTADATKAALQIANILYTYLMYGDGLGDPRLHEALYNKSVNVPVGADVGWDNPVAVGAAFSAALAAASTPLTVLDVVPIVKEA